MARYIDADALMKEFRDFVRESNNSDFAPVPNWNDAVSLVESAPTVTTDLSDYSDRLWQAAYERGKAEARKTGNAGVNVIRCKDCKLLSDDRIAPDWNRICTLYCVGKADNGYCDECVRKEP